LEWRAHSLQFAFRHMAERNEAFAASADGGILRCDARIAGGDRRKPLAAEFGLLWLCVPKRAGNDELPEAPAQLSRIMVECTARVVHCENLNPA
jgi:hypothetical protein